MLDRTRTLWEKQNRLVGDRRALFTAVAEMVDATSVLYAGSYVDITPSLIWPSVTYVDVDKRANQFFTDEAGVQELLVENGAEAGSCNVRFIGDDYSHALTIDECSVDLLISLYAGFISEHCTQYLRVGGHLLVNPSHGDAAMASLDIRYELVGVLVANAADYRVNAEALDTFLIPKRDVDVTVELLHETGRAIAYTKEPFAYLFERVR